MIDRAHAHLSGVEQECRTKLSVEFVVPGAPQGKARARSRIIKARDGRQFVSHYTPSGTVDYESRVQAAAREAMRDEAMTRHPCRVSIIAHCPIPVSWSKKKQAQALAGEIFPTGKPDLDNIEKSILDGMNKVVFTDDAVVCIVSKTKRYGSPPRVEVRVTELDGEPA